MQIELPTKLRKKMLRERAYEEIVRLIVSNELRCGGQIKEKRLIEKLQISRAPIREAIGVLAKEGLVEIKPYRGFYVRRFSHQEVNEIYEVYKKLECLAVELAVPRMSETGIGQVEQMLAEAAAALQSGDMDGFAASDRKFQRTIAEQSGNEALTEALARLALQIRLCSARAKSSREFVQRALNRRDDVMQAFKARDIPRATFLMGVYLDHMQFGILECLRNAAHSPAAS